MAGFSPYSDDPGTGPYVIFPNHGTQILSNFIHLIGVSLLSFCLARRTIPISELSFRRGWRNLPWSKICVLLVFIVSWTFVLIAGVLVNGVGLSYSLYICSSGIYICITLYALSKVLIYCFLVERVHVVWSARNSELRRDSLVYKVCLGILLVYIAIVVSMFVGQLSFFNNDRSCVIGLTRQASIPLLSYDLGLNVFLTAMFVGPLLGASRNRKFKLVARRAVLAAFVALTTSIVNIAVLTIMGSSGELGWICLASCSSDVMLNAIVIFWITSPPSAKPDHLTVPSLQMPMSLASPPRPPVDYSSHHLTSSSSITVPPRSHSKRSLSYVPSNHRRRPTQSTLSRSPAIIHQASGEALLPQADSLFEYSRSEHTASPVANARSSVDGYHDIRQLSLMTTCFCGRPYPHALTHRVVGHKESTRTQVLPGPVVYIPPFRDPEDPAESVEKVVDDEPHSEVAEILAYIARLPPGNNQRPVPPPITGANRFPP